MSSKGDFFWDTLYFARGAVGKHSLRGKILGFAELQSGTIMGDKSPIILTERKKKKIAAAAKKEMRARFEWAIDKEDMVDSLALDNNKNHNNNSNNNININNNDNNSIKTTKDTDESTAIDWMSQSTQEIAQMDTQFPSDDPGWWEMMKRNQELEKEMLELMKK